MSDGEAEQMKHVIGDDGKAINYYNHDHHLMIQE